jgi:hypothetical protein
MMLLCMEACPFILGPLYYNSFVTVNKFFVTRVILHPAADPNDPANDMQIVELDHL